MFTETFVKFDILCEIAEELFISKNFHLSRHSITINIASDNMDHCLRGIKQQSRCFPYLTPHEYSSVIPREQHSLNSWNVYSSEGLNPMYKGINQDIKWITKIKRKRSLEVEKEPSNINLSSNIDQTSSNFSYS